MAEPLTESQKSAFAAKMSASCAARYRLGYDLKGKRYDPPFTEEEISNFCQCAAATLADLLTKEEYMFIAQNIEPPERLKTSMIEKSACIAGEKCKQHLNLARPELFQQYEQCWKG
jgi:hypothetical protein